MHPPMNSKFKDPNELNFLVQREFWRSEESYDILREGFRQLYDNNLGVNWHCAKLKTIADNNNAEHNSAMPSSKSLQRFLSRDKRYSKTFRDRELWLTTIMKFCAHKCMELSHEERLKEPYADLLQLSSDYTSELAEHSNYGPPGEARKLNDTLYSKDDLLRINSAISTIKRGSHDDPHHPEFPSLRPQFPSTPTLSIPLEGSDDPHQR